MDVVKAVGKYLNTPVGAVCYNTDKVLTTILDKENVEGFASIILRLASKSGPAMSQEQILLSYQWLEHMAMYANQAAVNPTFAKNYLQGINKALARNTYLTGQFMTVTDIAAYHVLYPIIERLSVIEQESYLHVCRWSRHIQAQPRACTHRPPLPLNTLTLSFLAPVPAEAFAMQLPKQILPYELENLSLDKPVVYHPQPFSYPSYPIILYL